MRRYRSCWIIVVLLGLILLCSGCRMRIVETPQADLFLPLDSYAEVETDTAPSAPPEEADTDEPEEQEPEPSATPSPTAVPTPDPSSTPQPSSKPNPENRKANPNSTVQTVDREKSGDISKSDKKITVTLNPSSGSCPKSSITVSPGNTYGKLPEASRTGYQFVGWFLSPDDGVRVTDDTIVTISEDHTLYAHWSQSKKYTLTLDPQGGRLLKSEEKLELYTGESYGYLPIPRLPGYNLDGWYTSPTQGEKVTETSIFNGTEDMTLYAQWIYDPFAYWTFVLENTSQTIYFCQTKSGYLEYDQDHITPKYSSLLFGAPVNNVAENRGGGQVDDEWVQTKNPDILVKCVSEGTNLQKAAEALQTRLPGKPVFVVPVAAENGTPEQQLYYRLYFGKLVYPEWYEEVDMSAVASELGVSGSVFSTE